MSASFALSLAWCPYFHHCSILDTHVQCSHHYPQKDDCTPCMVIFQTRLHRSLIPRLFLKGSIFPNHNSLFIHPRQMPTQNPSSNHNSHIRLRCTALPLRHRPIRLFNMNVEWLKSRAVQRSQTPKLIKVLPFSVQVVELKRVQLHLAAHIKPCFLPTPWISQPPLYQLPRTHHSKSHYSSCVSATFEARKTSCDPRHTVITLVTNCKMHHKQKHHVQSSKVFTFNHHPKPMACLQQDQVRRPVSFCKFNRQYWRRACSLSCKMAGS